jgi:hypothetical protein
MKITLQTIEVLEGIITGNNNISPNRTGPELVNFFNQYPELKLINGGAFVYGQGFPSRADFTRSQLNRLNDIGLIKQVIKNALDPRHYIDSTFDLVNVVDHLNKYLIYDEIEVIKKGLHYCVRNKESTTMITQDFLSKFSEHTDSHSFIREQNEKCKARVEAKDYDGAIANARSMTEAIFDNILTQKHVDSSIHKGDLNQLFKEIKRYLKLNPNQADLSNTLIQMLSGLTSIVTSLAAIGNKMSERHVRKYRPARHHALLAVNAANTLCEFLISSQEHQEKRKEL